MESAYMSINWWMGKESIICIYTCIYTYTYLMTKLCHVQEMVGTGDHHIKWNKPDSERQISHVLWHLYILHKN
jgi:hypothetical protein